jgi:hypothetical protein
VVKKSGIHVFLAIVIVISSNFCYNQCETLPRELLLLLIFQICSFTFLILAKFGIISSTLFTFETRDFGHMIVDKGKGFRFRSRFSREDLLNHDFNNGAYLGRILKQEMDLPYPEF